MRRTNLDTLAVELQKVKGCFDEIFDLYNDIQDDFRVIFHSLQKDTFVEYLTDEEYDEVLSRFMRKKVCRLRLNEVNQQ